MAVVALPSVSKDKSRAPGGAGSWQTLLLHIWLWQSLGPLQCKPTTQAEHVAPPQSMSVSAPSVVPLVQFVVSGDF
jgi:hypothetical protein